MPSPTGSIPTGHTDAHDRNARLMLAWLRLTQGWPEGCISGSERLPRLRKRRLSAWWAMQGSNLRPLPCEGSALPLS